MEKYYIKSLIGEVAKGIERLIDQNVIQNDRRVILYGLDRYAFAMRTILSNKGFNNVECYISDDEAAVVMVNQDIKNFACRYLNRTSDLIGAETLEERLKPFEDDVQILIASQTYEQEKAKLKKLGYQENIHFYKVFDFVDEELESLFQNKTKMSLKEVQGVEKELLAYVDGICQKNDLRYWVCGGTLLGTIRHKGFIPWDDDVDIFLPWKDYQRFIEIFEEDEQFSMLGLGTSKVNDYSDMLAKVIDKRTLLSENIGTVRRIYPIGLDIFPLVGVPTDAEERHLFFTRYQELNRAIWQDFYATNGSIEVFPKWYKEQKAFLEQYDFDSSEYVGVIGTPYGEKDYTHKEVYDKTLKMPFEDIEVNVPVGYQEYLENLYGKDWGIIPDESKRKSHHDIEAYWL